MTPRPMLEAGALPLAGEATLPLPLPPPSWHRAAVSAHEAVRALLRAQTRYRHIAAKLGLVAIRRKEAIDALRVLGAALDDCGHEARAAVWQMAGRIDLGNREPDLPGYVAWLEEIAAGGEDREPYDPWAPRAESTEPCKHDDCELCLCPCGLPASDAYHSPEQREACRAAFLEAKP